MKGYKYKVIKWNTRKSKVYDHEGCSERNAPKYIGIYEDENSLIGRNNSITYRASLVKEYKKHIYPSIINNIKEETVLEVGEWHLEIKITNRRDVLNILKSLGARDDSRVFVLHYRCSTLEECKEKAETLNKFWHSSN